MPLLRATFYVLLLVISLTMSTEVSAQSPLQYGGLGGLSVATQSPGDDARTGFNLSLFVDYPALPYAAVSLEAAFGQKGQLFDGVYEQPEPDGSVTEIDGSFTLALDYASFTLAAKPFVPLGRRGASLYAVAGPRLDVLVQEKLLFEGLDQAIRFSIDEHETTVWGYDVGLGVRAGALLPVPLLAELRFSGDLTNAFDGTSRDATRNQVFQVRAGIEF